MKYHQARVQSTDLHYCLLVSTPSSLDIGANNAAWYAYMELTDRLVNQLREQQHDKLNSKTF